MCTADVEELKNRLKIIESDLESAKGKIFIALMSEYSEIKNMLSELAYSTYSFDQKVQWWGQQTLLQMRMQSEAGEDEWVLFDKAWYDQALIKEPQLSEILVIMCKKTGIDYECIKKLVQFELNSKEWIDIRSKIKS